MKKPRSTRNANRNQIRSDVRKNVDLITANLNSLWHRTAEDFVASGISAAQVANSLFTVAIAHKLKNGGACALIDDLDKTIELLRPIAASNADAAQAATRH